MASPPLPSLVFFLSLALAPFKPSAAPNSTPPQGLRLRLVRAAGPSGNLTKMELLQRSVGRDKEHLRRDPRGAAAPVTPGRFEFLVELGIGTPSVPFLAILDTGSDLTWTQCKPCVDCYLQSTPVFDPLGSSTFSGLPCSSKLCRGSECNESRCLYTYDYGGGAGTRGVLATESLVFGAARLPGVAFGCGHENHGTEVLFQASGLVGLGRGALSLVTQLGFGKFSYCLTGSTSSPLLLGSLASVEGAGGASRSTPLLTNAAHPSFYYLSLLGVTVGDARLDIPASVFTIAEDGGGGLIVDSGTTLTYLRAEAYREVRKALVSQVQAAVADGSRHGFDLCFLQGGGGRGMPRVVFHFDGADMELRGEDYVVEGGLTGDAGLRCVAIAPSAMELSILGNYVQQGMLVLYDLKNNVLSFARAQCEQL